MTPTRPAEQTVPRPPDQDQPGLPWQQTQVAPVPVVGVQPVGEIERLLRKRLRFLSLLMTGGLVVELLLIAGTKETPPVWAYFGVGVLGVGTVAWVVLWVRRSLSLGQLRAIELVIFGALYVLLSSAHAFLYPRLMVLPQPPAWFGVILAYALSLPWGFL